MASGILLHNNVWGQPLVVKETPFRNSSSELRKGLSPVGIVVSLTDVAKIKNTEGFEPIYTVIRRNCEEDPQFTAMLFANKVRDELAQIGVKSSFEELRYHKKPQIYKQMREELVRNIVCSMDQSSTEMSNADYCRALFVARLANLMETSLRT